MKFSRSMSKQKKTAAALLGAAAAALLVTNKMTSGPYFNPEENTFVERALAQERSLVDRITSYDTSEELTLPDMYNNVADVWSPLLPTDQPMLWYVPKSGGDTLMKIFYNCLGLTHASKLAARVDPTLDTAEGLEVKTDEFIGSYVNVDLSTAEGISRAQSWGLVQSGEVDVLASHRLKEALPLLFDSTHKARLFAYFRHPIKRVVDLFYYRQRSTFEPTYDRELAGLSLLEFGRSKKLIDNFVTRSLIGKAEVELTDDDIELAKNILRRKFFVGISEPNYYEMSVVRVEKYFNWWDDYDVRFNLTVNYCHDYQIKHGSHFTSHPKAQRKDTAYNLIAVRNYADIEVYAYVKQLFGQQMELI